MQANDLTQFLFIIIFLEVSGDVINKKAMIDYICYYNERISSKRKGMMPIQHRHQALHCI
jgi:hypothetical protein